jgi:hypothetical protein
MRTRKSTVTFQSAFLLNRDVGELPAGSYDIEIDEEEVGTMERSAYRRTAVYLLSRRALRPAQLRQLQRSWTWP